MNNVFNRYAKEVSQLEDLCTKYELTSLKDRVAAISDRKTIRIAFLGEFNSGKSTIINTILGSEVVPTSIDVCSGNYVTIEFSKISENEYYDFSTNQTRVSKEDFIQMARGRARGLPYVKVPQSEYFSNDVLFFDTPGLDHSDTHNDLAYGLLPFLDGIVLCSDIQRGNLSNSVIEFISKESVKPYHDKMIIVLTKSDQLSGDEAEAVLEHVRQSLIDTNITAISHSNYLDMQSQLLLSAIDDRFMKRYIEILLERRKSEINLAIKDILEGMHDAYEALSFDSTLIEQKMQELRDESVEIHEKKQKVKDSISDFRTNLRNRLKSLGETLAYTIANETADKHDSTTSAFADEINKVIERELDKLHRSIAKIGDFSNPDSGSHEHFIHAITNKIESIKTNIDRIVRIITAMIFTKLPIGGVGNILEAGLGYILTKYGKSSQDKSSDNGENPNLARNKDGLIKYISKIINELNPVVLVGDIAKKFIIERELRDLVNDFERLAAEFSDILEGEIVGSVISQLEEQNKERMRNLVKTIDILKQGSHKVAEARQDIEQDMESVRNLTL